MSVTYAVILVSVSPLISFSQLENKAVLLRDVCGTWYCCSIMPRKERLKLLKRVQFEANVEKCQKLDSFFNSCAKPADVQTVGILRVAQPSTSLHFDDDVALNIPQASEPPTSSFHVSIAQEYIEQS
ncbi:Uncharacterised protein r2_g3144 [Pycnogonum litorale]